MTSSSVLCVSLLHLLIADYLVFYFGPNSGSLTLIGSAPDSFLLNWLWMMSYSYGGIFGLIRSLSYSRNVTVVSPEGIVLNFALIIDVAN